MYRLALIYFGFAVFFFIPSKARGIEAKFANTLQITVSGDATVQKPADQIELLVEVMTEDKDVKKAVEQNKQKMNAILSNLDKIGLAKEEYRTTNYH